MDSAIDFNDHMSQNFWRKYPNFLPKMSLQEYNYKKENGTICRKKFLEILVKFIHKGCNKNGTNINDKDGNEHIENIICYALNEKIQIYL